MDLPSVLRQIADLPSTYLRSGSMFAQLQAAKAAALHRYTNAADGVISQAQFVNAIGAWLDTWGRLFNIPRNDGESNETYLARIKFICTVSGGAPASILAFLTEAENVAATLTENFSTVSWSVSLSSGLASSQYNQIADDLKYVRPAGVPFTMNTLKGGLYLGTLNYFGDAPRVTGAFLTSPVSQFSFNLSPNTNNAVPSLPTVFLTDPTINPSLAA